MAGSLQHIGIIGAGPAGCALACFLQRRGLRVTVFDNEKRPDLLVGESLLPAIIPLLRTLEIEDQVAEIATVKRGAALRHSDGTRVDFEFRPFGRHFPNYAYNVPRPQFDNLLRNRAEQLGVRFVVHHARMQADPASQQRQVWLADETLGAAGLQKSEHPDLLVDASGRARVFSRLLKIAASRGPRNDVAHFAHFTGFASDSALKGQVVISVLEHGWAWQIPLPDRTSVGVVVDQHAAQNYGSDANSRLASIIDSNPQLARAGKHRKQITSATSYANYQLISERAGGPGWVLLGDALGFVDPMLSPGVFMALESARLLDERLFAAPSNKQFDNGKALQAYYDELRGWHQSWGQLIEYFYDGRMLALGQQRNAIRAARKLSFGRIAEPIVSRSLAQMVGGIATRSRFNQQALYQSCQHLIKDPILTDSLSIKSASKQEINQAA